MALLKNGIPAQSPAENETFVPPVGFKNGNGIRDAIRCLMLPSRFTSDEVVTALEKDNFPFTATDHRKPVRDALYIMSHGDSPMFRKVKEGKGGLPSIYERISLM